MRLIISPTPLPKFLPSVLTALILALVAAMYPAASARADVLADVRSRGELICGVITTAKPFGYIDNSKGRDAVGYDVDICKAVARELGVKATLRQVASDSRIPELMQGRIDILTAALSWTPERANQIDFTDQYFVARLVLATRKDSGLDTFAALKGKRVSVAKGSTSEFALRSRYPEVNILGFPDPSTAFLAFDQGKTEAFSISELLMERFIADAKNKSNIQVLNETLQTDPWGIGVRKGEQGLLLAVNTSLEKLEKSGEGAAIFEKWFNEETGYSINRNFRFEPIEH